MVIPSCNSNSIEFYANKKNKIDLKSFFSGDIEGWGAIFDYNGRVTRSFYVTIKASWDGDVGTIDELFRFDG